MLPERDNHDNFTLDAEGYAIPQADLLADWYIEHGDDPLEGDPEGWPDWTDDDRVWLGSAKCRAEAFDDLPDDEDVDVEF